MRATDEEATRRRLALMVVEKKAEKKKRRRKKKWNKHGRLGPQKSESESSSDEEEKIELTALLREHGASDDYPEWSKVCT